MNWIKVTNYGDPFITRAGHHIALKNNQICIFGGFNDQGYINFDPLNVE